MTLPLTVQQATRRYVSLTALRWLPVGLTVPVSVLLASARGLTLEQIGFVLLVFGVTVMLLELPTGGLADTLGRRPVLVASGLLHVGYCVAFATADSVTGFTVAMVLHATGRALDSGPLQAWYVDTVHLTDPRADVVPGLSRGAVADCLALSLGAFAGGLSPGLLQGSGADALVLPFVAAAALGLVSVTAVLLLVPPTGPPRTASAFASVRRGVTAVPSTVGEALSLAARDAAVRRVLLLSAAGGVMLSALELLGPGLFAELSGSRTGGSAVYGTVMAVAFLGGAAGSALAPSSRRLMRGSTRAAVTVLSLVSGLAVALVAPAVTVVAAACAYAAFYVAHAAAWPLLHAVLHDRVGAAHRSSLLSAASLALMLGGALTNLALPVLASLGGRPAAYAVAGGVGALAALLAAGLPNPMPVDDHEQVADGLTLGR